jgi:hypothetical protein
MRRRLADETDVLGRPWVPPEAGPGPGTDGLRAIVPAVAGATYQRSGAPLEGKA